MKLGRKFDPCQRKNREYGARAICAFPGASTVKVWCTEPTFGRRRNRVLLSLGQVLSGNPSAGPEVALLNSGPCKPSVILGLATASRAKVLPNSIVIRYVECWLHLSVLNHFGHTIDGDCFVKRISCIRYLLGSVQMERLFTFHFANDLLEYLVFRIL